MYQQIQTALQNLADPMRAESSLWFFKTGPGQYGEGDEFIGITVPDQRRVAKQFYKLTTLKDLQKLIESPIHEHRLTALFILILQFQKAKDEEVQKEIVDFYLQNLDYVNNWDLVDASAYKILGPYLFRRDKKLLYDLARSGHLWRQRVSIISTFHFIKNEHFEDALQISEILLDHEHDLIHKAVGWMLREIGNVALEVEDEFLKKHYRQMPRTMLRYAIEKFVPEKRQKYLKGQV
jgi:3-methyladenine DNA glycosylase AlkD